MTSCVGNTCDDPDGLLPTFFSVRRLLRSQGPKSVLARDTILQFFLDIQLHQRVDFPKSFLEKNIVSVSP
jgi:hypothetical protein